MVEDISLYSFSGVKRLFRDLENSLCGRYGERSGNFRYGDFQFSFLVGEEKGNLELIVDVGAMNGKEEIEGLEDYTKWFKEWDIYSPSSGNVSLSNVRIPDLEELKQNLTFIDSSSPSTALVRIRYKIGNKFKEKQEKQIQKRAFRALVFLPLKTWIDTKFPERRKYS